MASDFHFLEHVALADAAFEAVGDSPSDLFTAAARAVIETMVNPVTVGSVWKRDMGRDDPELPGLLFDWLSDLVFLKDAEGVMFSDISVSVTEDRAMRVWRLHGTLIGEPLDQLAHRFVIHLNE